MRIVFSIIGTILASIVLAIPAFAQETTPQTVTLYSPLQYTPDSSRAFFDFQTGQLAKRRADWDLAYGLLRAGQDFDWFQSSGALGNRSVIKDLGRRAWTDYFDVPLIKPLPKLKAGEQRTITVDTSGADGADGAPGADAPGVDRDGVVRPRPPINARPKRDGTPKIDPIFVRARAGHIYAIHVVTDTQDFYALFRVESLKRGDHCTISWRLIPAPAAETVRKEK